MRIAGLEQAHARSSWPSPAVMGVAPEVPPKLMVPLLALPHVLGMAS